MKFEIEIIDGKVDKVLEDLYDILETNGFCEADADVLIAIYDPLCEQWSKKQREVND